MDFHLVHFQQVPGRGSAHRLGISVAYSSLKTHIQVEHSPDDGLERRGNVGWQGRQFARLDHRDELLLSLGGGERRACKVS